MARLLDMRLYEFKHLSHILPILMEKEINFLLLEGMALTFTLGKTEWFLMVKAWS